MIRLRVGEEFSPLSETKGLSERFVHDREHKISWDTGRLLTVCVPFFFRKFRDNKFIFKKARKGFFVVERQVKSG